MGYAEFSVAPARRGSDLRECDFRGAQPHRQGGNGGALAVLNWETFALDLEIGIWAVGDRTDGRVPVGRYPVELVSTAACCRPSPAQAAGDKCAGSVSVALYPMRSWSTAACCRPSSAGVRISKSVVRSSVLSLLVAKGNSLGCR